MIKKIIEKIFGKCGRCESWFVYPKKRRTNTAYENDALNFTVECKMCYEHTEAYWEEMWKDYYNKLL